VDAAKYTDVELWSRCRWKQKTLHRVRRVVWLAVYSIVQHWASDVWTHRAALLEAAWCGLFVERTHGK